MDFDYSLRETDIHVWQVDLDEPRDPRILSSADREHVLSFVDPLIRRRRQNGRCTQRALLSSYVEQDPADMRINRDLNGRPYVVGSAIDFNWSQRDSVGLLAIARQRVGIDVEACHQRNLEAAEAACTPQELRLLNSHGNAMQLFAQLWAAKEACLKADGRGLGVDPADFAVLDTSACLVKQVPVPRGAQWQIQALSVGPAHTAAVASERPARLELRNAIAGQ
jgi:phosphopantetheine--protein transferase-like protein